MKKRIFAAIMIAALVLSGCGAVSNSYEAVSQPVTDETLEKIITGQTPIENSDSIYKGPEEITIDDVQASDFFIKYYYPFVNKEIPLFWNDVETFVSNADTETEIGNFYDTFGSMAIYDDSGDCVFISFDINDDSKNRMVDHICYYRKEINAEMNWYPYKKYYTFRIIGGEKLKFETFEEAICAMFDPKDEQP